MGNKTTFKFKKFEINHDKCAMKIGTDGVLLGAWVDLSTAYRVLDVGSGTGLISMMIAQRNQSTQIIGLEIDELAAKQSIQNVLNSSFKEQIKIVNDDFVSSDLQEEFDLIVSNPPFFIDSLKSNEEQRNKARHTDVLSPKQLFEKAFKVLNTSGSLAIIFPSDSNALIEKLARNVGFYTKRKCHVYPRVDSVHAKRTLWQFSKTKVNLDESDLKIEKERHVYTEEYICLTREFYLKM